MFHLKRNPKTDKSERFWFTFEAKNGETIFTSETYNGKSGAIKGMKSVILNISGASASNRHDVTACKTYIDETNKSPKICNF